MRQRETRPCLPPRQKSPELCVNPRRELLHPRVRYPRRRAGNFTASLWGHGKGPLGPPGGGHRLEAAQQVSAGPARAVRMSWHHVHPRGSASSRCPTRFAAPAGTRLQTGPSGPMGPHPIALPKRCEKRRGTHAWDGRLGVRAAGGADPASPPGAAGPGLQQRPRAPARRRDRAGRWTPGVQMLSPGSPVRGCWPGSRSRLSDLTSSAYN